MKLFKTCPKDYLKLKITQLTTEKFWNLFLLNFTGCVWVGTSVGVWNDVAFSPLFPFSHQNEVKIYKISAKQGIYSKSMKNTKCSTLNLWIVEQNDKNLDTLAPFNSITKSKLSNQTWKPNILARQKHIFVFSWSFS